ncbi:hypothetical protein WJX77_005515 [Trebouxia sp. C0004]
MSIAASDAPHLVQRSRPDAQPRRLRSLTGGLSLEDSQLSSTAQGPRQPSSSSEAVYESAQDDSLQSGSHLSADELSESESADQVVRAPRVPAAVGQGRRDEVYIPTEVDGWNTFVVKGTKAIMATIAGCPNIQLQIQQKQMQRAVSRYLVPVRLHDYYYRATKYYQDLLPPALGPRPLLIGGVTQSRKTVMIAVMIVVAEYLQNKPWDSEGSSLGNANRQASSQCVPCVIVTDKRAAQKSLITKLQHFLKDRGGRPLVAVKGTSAGKKFEEELSDDWSDSAFHQRLTAYVAFKHYGHLQRIMTVLSAKQRRKTGLYWFLIQDECDALEGDSSTKYDQAMQVLVGQAPHQLNNLCVQCRCIPPQVAYVSATLLPTMLALKEEKIEVLGEDIILMPVGDEYHDVGRLKLLREGNDPAGKEVFLDDGEWGHTTKLSPSRSWGPKLDLLFEDTIATPFGTAVLIGNSGTKRQGGVFDVALLARDKYRDRQLTTVAVSAQEICIYWADGLGPIKALNTKNSNRGRHEFIKLSVKVSDEDGPGDQLETHFHKITGIIGAAPLAIMGYLPMHRSISYVFEWPPNRPEGEDPQYSRCITQLLCLIGPSCTFETYVQAIGRATGELQDFLQQAGRDSVVVLTEKVDLEAAKRWYRFQDQLILRMQKGEFDEHGQLTFEPCNLETAMGRTIKADENFIISQVMRGVPNARRFGLRGRQYAPSLSEDDPLMEQIRRMRTLFSSAQRLRGETKQINDCLPQLKDLDNPLAIQGLRNLDIEQQIHAADPNDMPLEMEEFVVANELRIVSLDELEIEDLVVESEDTSVQTLRKPSWLQNKLHSLLGMGTTVTGRQDTPALYETKRLRLHGSNPAAWDSSRKEKHWHGCFYRPVVCQEDGDLPEGQASSSAALPAQFVVALKMRYTEQELRELYEQGGKGIVWLALVPHGGDKFEGQGASSFSQVPDVQVCATPGKKVEDLLEGLTLDHGDVGMETSEGDAAVPQPTQPTPVRRRARRKQAKASSDNELEMDTPVATSVQGPALPRPASAPPAQGRPPAKYQAIHQTGEGATPGPLHDRPKRAAAINVQYAESGSPSSSGHSDFAMESE